MQLMLKQEKSKHYLIINYFSSVKWKSAVDETASFLDGGKIPCLLVENKIDLVEDSKKYDPDFESFAQKNGFCGCFRTSAKTGENISESMEFLIKNIIYRMEDMSQKENKIFTNDKFSLIMTKPINNVLSGKFIKF